MSTTTRLLMQVAAKIQFLSGISPFFMIFLFDISIGGYGIRPLYDGR